MMRMMLEIAMVLGLVGGLTFVMTALAKESKRDKALLDENEKNEPSISPDKAINPDTEK